MKGREWIVYILGCALLLLFVVLNRRIAQAGRRVSTTLRQVLTKFSEFFVCWIRVPSFPREISLQDRLATTIGDSVDPQHSRFCRFSGAFRFSKVARCCFICIVPVR